MAKTFFTVVVVDHPDELAQWYEERFGFKTVVSLGWYTHQRDDCGHELGWMQPNQDHQPAPWKNKPLGYGFGLCFEVIDVEEAWKNWGHSEVQVLPLIREEWGQYHFTVRDPAGNLVDVIQLEQQE